MSVTQKEIADRLGVSRSVVALALNGYPQVAEETRRRVNEMAQELGYNAQSSLAARSLISKRHDRPHRSGLLAILAPDPLYVLYSSGTGALRDMPFYASLLEGIERGAARLENDIFFCSPRNNVLPRFITDRMVDGVIVFDTDTLALMNGIALPVVLAGLPSPNAFYLAPDEEVAVYEATQYLIGLGHRAIAFLGGSESGACMNRMAGYRRAMDENNLPCWIDESDGAMQDGVAGITKLLQAKGMQKSKRKRTGPLTDFTAIVCRNDMIAMGAAAKAQEAGLRIPQDLSIIGFDDVTTQYEFKPAITSVRFDRVAMGRRAVELLCRDDERERLILGANDRKCCEIFPAELVLRESTAPPP